ncbi:thermonuclease family protein [Mesorhizobium sp. M0910]
MFVSWDWYGRYVGNCRRADGASVAAWMVENGQALDWPKYSQGAYAMLQEKAKAARVGIWAGTFEAPWDWRAERRADNEQPSTIAPLLAARPVPATSRATSTPAVSTSITCPAKSITIARS